MSESEHDTGYAPQVDAQLDTPGSAVAQTGIMEQAVQAGAMLRQLRQSANVDPALLACALKVAPQKIQALEEGRLDDLPGLTFVRGLAAAVCRYLAVDPDPVLAFLPRAVAGVPVEPDVPREPFKPTTFLTPGNGSLNSSRSYAGMSGGLLVAVAVLLVAALAMWLMPARWLTFSGPLQPASSAPPASSAVSAAVAGVASGPVEPPASVPEPQAPSAADMTLPSVPAASAAALPSRFAQASAAASATSAPEPAMSAMTNHTAEQDVVTFTATDRVWIGVKDRNGKSVFDRILTDGDTVSVGGALPLSVIVGNKDAVTVTVRGQSLDLSNRTRGGLVARFTVDPPAHP